MAKELKKETKKTVRKTTKAKDNSKVTFVKYPLLFQTFSYLCALMAVVLNVFDVINLETMWILLGVAVFSLAISLFPRNFK